MGWEYSLKVDCIRSSLIECQSFTNRKIDVDPVHRVLMLLPCAVPRISVGRGTAGVSVFGIFVVFVSWINRQEEYCLSLDLRASVHGW